MLLVVVYGAMPCYRPYPTMAAPLADDDYYESQGLVCRGRPMYERGEAFIMIDEKSIVLWCNGKLEET